MKILFQQLVGSNTEPCVPMMLVELLTDDLADLIRRGMIETQVFNTAGVLCQRYVVALHGRGINVDRLPEK